MVVAGQRGGEIVSSKVDPLGLDVIEGLAIPSLPYFIVIPSGKSDVAYLGELVDVPVSSSGRQLLGKTVQFSINRDHGLLQPSAVEALQRKWKGYGVLWTGIQDSEMVSVPIPVSPATVDCRKDERF